MSVSLLALLTGAALGFRPTTPWHGLDVNSYTYDKYCREFGKVRCFQTARYELVRARMVTQSPSTLSRVCHDEALEKSTHC